jgi:hypothetical protein
VGKHPRLNQHLMSTKIDGCSWNTLEFLKLRKIFNSIIFVALDLATSTDPHYLGSLNSRTIVENKKEENL